MKADIDLLDACELVDSSFDRRFGGLCLLPEDVLEKLNRIYSAVNSDWGDLPDEIDDTFFDTLVAIQNELARREREG